MRRQHGRPKARLFQLLRRGKDMNEKQCITCQVFLPTTSFSKNRSKKDGLHYRCKDCDAQKARQWYEGNKDRVRTRKAERRLDDEEAFKQRHRDFYLKNKEKILNSRKDYYLRNKKSIIDRVSEWRLANTEKARQYVRNHYSENKNYYTDRSVRRRVAKVSATPPWLSAIERAQIQEMYDVAAALTVQTGVRHHVDHIHPLKGRGFNGLHVPWNLQVLQAAENLSKGSRLPSNEAHLAWGG